jgi:hypothetical protein
MTKDDVLDGYNVDAIHKVSELLGDEADLSGMSALQLYMWLKRVNELSKLLMHNIVEQANIDFTSLKGTSKNAKNWSPTDFATVTELTPRGTWIYPQEIVECEAQLKSTKEAMKKDKRATYRPGVLDPVRDCAFKVQLQKV